MAEWISYESAAEPVAEISVDVDFADDDEYRATHPFAVIVTVRGFSAGPDGQPGDDVASALYGVEEAVEAALAGNDAALACSVTGSGTFTLYGYASQTGVEQTVRAAASTSPFAAEVRTERDGDWSYYERYILRGEELEEARDAEQLEQLEELGDDLDADYEVAFALNFDDHDGLRASLPALRGAGFAVPEELFGEETEITVTRVMTLSTDALKAARAQLVAAAAAHGGEYDGWGADPVEENET